MKKCPTCEKTFDDNLRFCQSDGTPLVSADEEPAKDPYKTTVAKVDELPIPPEEPKEEEPEKELDPFKTMVAGGNLADLEKEADSVTPKEEPKEEVDPMKTMVVSGNTSDDIKIDIPLEEPVEEEKPTPPPSPFGEVDSSTPEKPKFEEPEFSAPLPPIDKKEEVSEPKSEPSEPKVEKTPTFDEKPKTEEPKPSSSSGDAAPIPSPFDKSMPPGYITPSTPPFDPTEPVKAEKVASVPDFEDPKESPKTDDDWSPPSAPMEKSGSGGGIESSPTAEGQNLTMAYVSMALGILSCLCCFSPITGPGGVITGIMARSKASSNPEEYGGETFALIGMITGVIGTLLGIALAIWLILTNFL